MFYFDLGNITSKRQEVLQTYEETLESDLMNSGGLASPGEL